MSVCSKKSSILLNLIATGRTLMDTFWFLLLFYLVKEFLL